MKQFIKRLVVFAVAFTLVIGLLPGNSAEAASKKSKKKTIVVTTQEELVAALKKYGSSNSKVKIKIETTEASTFTLSAKYSSDSIQIVVDAPNATIKSKAKVSSITINEAKSVKEYASGNKITVNDEKLTFTAMENASVEKLTIASETGTVKVVNNGGIEKVAVKSEVKVDLTQNGEMGRVYVGAAADISVSGTSEESLKVTVQKDAVGASVKSEVPVSVNAYADVDLTLEKGAESSKVTMKEETAGVKLENKTEETISVKDTEGNTQKVETGEEITSDNYVGKQDETTEKPPVVEDEKKEEEKKEEEKKPEPTNAPLPTPDPEPYVPYVSPEEQLQDKLTAAGKSQNDGEAWLTQNITLKKDLYVPSGVGLVLDGYTLNADSNKIVLGPDARIVLFPGSKLIVGNDPFIYEDDGKGFNHVEFQLEFDASIQIGDYTIVGIGSDFDPVATRIIIETSLRHEMVRQYPEEEVSDSNPESELIFTERNVRFDFMGESFDIFTESGTYEGFAGVFGGDRAYWVDMDGDYRPQNGETLTSLEINPLSNVLYDERKVTFKGKTIYSATVGVEDWLNVYLDPDMVWSAFKAVEQKRAVPDVIEVPEKEGDPLVVTIPGPITLTKNVYVRKGATLIADEINYALSDPVQGPVGGDLLNAPGISVRGTLKINRITSTGSIDENQELIKMQGADSILEMGGKIYKIDTNDQRFTDDPNATAYSYFCWNIPKQYYGYQLYTWEFEEGFKILCSNDDGENFVEVVKHPFEAELVTPDTLLVTKDSDQVYSLIQSTSRWMDWSDTDEFKDEIYAGKTLDEKYAIAAGDRLDFTSATLSAQDKNGNKVPLVIEEFVRDEEGELTDERTWLEVCGMTLTADPEITVTLASGAEMRIRRGSNLIMESISADNAGKFILGSTLRKNDKGENEIDRSGRITVDWGGKVTIGNYVFATQNYQNDFDSGNFGLSLDVVTDGKGSPVVRMQIPENIIITTLDGSSVTAEGLNALGMKIEISNKEQMDEKDEIKRNGIFPSISLGNDRLLFVTRDGGQFAEGKVTFANSSTDNGEFVAGSIEDLKAISLYIKGINGEAGRGYPDDKGITISYVSDSDKVSFDAITLDLMGKIVFSDNITEIGLANRSKVTVSMEVKSGCRLQVGSDCYLGTSKVDDTVIYGNLSIYDRGVFRSQMDHGLVIASGASFHIGNGRFECECVRYPVEGQSETYSYVFGFANNSDNLTLNGQGGIFVFVEYKDGAPEFTDDEFNTLLNHVRGEAREKLSVYKYTEPEQPAAEAPRT